VVLRTFRQLFDSHDENAIVGANGAGLVVPDDLEVIAWRQGTSVAGFRQVSTITRRHFSGEGVEVIAQGGRNVRCTPDHPFIVRREGLTALREAQDLRIGDQLPGVFLPPSEHSDLVPPERQYLGVATGAQAAITPRRAQVRSVKWCRIGAVNRFPLDADVYSLEVPTAHTFAVNGLVVHNCFPKDVSALKQLAGNSGYHFQLLTAVIEVNELQKRRVVSKLKKHLGSLVGKKVALLGLAFKPHTDDMREASSVVLASRLQGEGAIVSAYDPVAEERAGEMLTGVGMCDSALNAVEGADAAVIVTEWPEFADLDLSEVRNRMVNPVIVDGRNMLDPRVVREAGFVYEGIGRI
jgi:hypothetical protein